MVNTRPKLEESVMELQQVEVLKGQGMPRQGAIRQMSVIEPTVYRWNAGDKEKRLLDGFPAKQLRCNGHEPAGGTETPAQ